MNADRRTVLITGSSRGLGLALTAEFCRRGWTVFALVRNPSSVQSLVDLGVHKVIVADLREDGSASEIHQNLSGVKLDLLINNAGIPGSGKTLETLELKNFADLFDIHCVAAGRAVKAGLEALRRSQNPAVLNISSRLSSLGMNHAGGFDAVPVSYSYRIAKAAQNMLTVCLHKDLGKSGIRVFALHPGEIVTGSQSRDAKLTPAAAAENVYAFLEKIPSLEAGRLYRTGGEVIEW